MFESHHDAITTLLGRTSVVTGDFNFSRTASCYSAMTATHIDTCSAAGGGSCLSTVDMTIRTDISAPSLGIDYVFARFAGADSARWSVHSADSDHTINSGVVMSDHFPVIAELVRFE